MKHNMATWMTFVCLIKGLVLLQAKRSPPVLSHEDKGSVVQREDSWSKEDESDERPLRDKWLKCSKYLHRDQVRSVDLEALFSELDKWRTVDNIIEPQEIKVKLMLLYISKFFEQITKSYRPVRGCRTEQTRECLDFLWLIFDHIKKWYGKDRQESIVFGGFNTRK